MALDGIVSSPHRRSQTQNAFSTSSPSSSSRKQYTKGDELGSCSTILQRHRFLLTALTLLAFLCTIYLYFAITLGASELCAGLTGTQKALCPRKRCVERSRQKQPRPKKSSNSTSTRQRQHSRW